MVGEHVAALAADLRARERRGRRRAVRRDEARRPGRRRRRGRGAAAGERDEAERQPRAAEPGDDWCSRGPGSRMQRSVTIPARHPGRNADRSGGVPRRMIALLAVAWTGVVLVFWFGLFVASMRPGLFRPEAADLYGYFLPKLAYAAEEIAHGRLP